MAAVTPKAPLRVLVVDDHPVVRAGLATIISSEPDMAAVAMAEDGPSAVALFERHRPDVVVMDLGIPGMTGVDVIAAVRRAHPEARFVVLTVYEGAEDIDRALQAGARGYLLKDIHSEELLRAIREVSRGGVYLPPPVVRHLADRPHQAFTPRELDVLRLMVAGRRDKEIAADLGVSLATVRTHVNNVLGKLGVKSRAEASATALKRGLLHLSDL